MMINGGRYLSHAYRVYMVNPRCRLVETGMFSDMHVYSSSDMYILLHG